MGYSKIKSSALKNEYVDSEVNEYMIDSPSDLISITDCAPGSMAQTADMSYVYVMDQNGNWKSAGGTSAEESSLLSEGAPYQYLVTDGSGVAKWEDKPFGEKMEEVVVVEKMTFTPETPLVKLSAPFREINVGQVYHVMLDGERYDVEASYSTGILEISASNGVFEGKVSYGEAALTIVALPAADSGYIGVEHTIEVLTTEESIKTIDPKYLPGGGLVKTAIIKGDTYDATMEYFRKMQIDPSTAGDNPIKPTPADSFTCTNMSFEEANDFLLNGGVLNVVVLTMGKCVLSQNVSLNPIGERKITGGILFESNLFSFMWTPDSIKFTSG